MSFPSDGSFGISSPIHIVCSDWFGWLLQWEIGFGQETNVNEVSCGTTVDEGSGFDDLCSGS